MREIEIEEDFIEKLNDHISYENIPFGDGVNVKRFNDIEMIMSKDGHYEGICSVDLDGNNIKNYLSESGEGKVTFKYIDDEIKDLEVVEIIE
ncbi:hypothetical protein [Clostridium sulfidigenes]|uniref:hypothetical protein n=1 Tax=Clostridium sulfidigenes TaxID=318464 RepID=UPI003F8C873D